MALRETLVEIERLERRYGLLAVGFCLKKGSQARTEDVADHVLAYMERAVALLDRASEIDVPDLTPPR